MATSFGAHLALFMKKYFIDLQETKNAILFDLPHFGNKPCSPRVGYAISAHRITKGYSLEYYPMNEHIDIPYLNLWLSTEPWFNGATTVHERGDCEVTLGAPQVEPLFDRKVMFTVIITSIIPLDGT